MLAAESMSDPYIQKLELTNNWLTCNHSPFVQVAGRATSQGQGDRALGGRFPCESRRLASCHTVVAGNRWRICFGASLRDGCRDQAGDTQYGWKVHAACKCISEK